MQPSLLFWPRGRKPEVLHHCISKGKEIQFFTAEIPVAYQCKYERNWHSPPHLLSCSCLFKLTLPHQRKLRVVLVVGTAPSWASHAALPKTTSSPWSHAGEGVRCCRTECELSHGETCMSAFPPPPPRVQRDGEGWRSPFRGWLGHPCLPQVSWTQ